LLCELYLCKHVLLHSPRAIYTKSEHVLLATQSQHFSVYVTGPMHM